MYAVLVTGGKQYRVAQGETLRVEKLEDALGGGDAGLQHLHHAGDLAERLVELAHQHGADAVAHGATGKGNDQVRFELSAYALDPAIKVIAPWRLWELTSRTKLIEFAEQNQIPIAKDKRGEAPFSVDANLLHSSSEGKVLEDPAVEAPDLSELGEALLSRRGEASGVAIAREMLAAFDRADPGQRLAFLQNLADRFGPDPASVARALAAVERDPEGVEAVEAGVAAAMSDAKIRTHRYERANTGATLSSRPRTGALRAAPRHIPAASRGMRATAVRPHRFAVRAPRARAHAAVRASAGALPGLHRAS